MAAGKAGVEFVPVFDVVFTELPAEVDVAALVAADEVDEAGLKILEFAADVGEFIDVGLKVQAFGVEAFLEGLLVAGGFGDFDLFVEIGHGLVRTDDVSHDAADEGEGFVSLGEGKAPFRTGRSNRTGGSRLGTSHNRPPFTISDGFGSAGEPESRCQSNRWIMSRLSGESIQRQSMYRQIICPGNKRGKLRG